MMNWLLIVTGVSAFLVDRRKYLLSRERKFLADLVEIDRVLKGEK